MCLAKVVELVDRFQDLSLVLALERLSIIDGKTLLLFCVERD
jgi:hypothetical protein